MNKTQSNLLKAFAGESMARSKYIAFAKKAREEGWEWIARIFEETAENETSHALREFALMQSKVEMTNTYNIHAVGSTVENLKAAAEGEHYEWESMYPEFEAVAKEENQTAAAIAFKEIAAVEVEHEKRYMKLAELLKTEKLYQADEEVEWKCLHCGYVHRSKDAPKVCPACLKPQGFFMRVGLVQ
ncbi:MAG: rubrerythrin [Patescibacteria group bacterium]